MSQLHYTRNFYKKRLALIRRKQKNGEEYYKVLYYIYITDKNLNCSNDILDKLYIKGYTANCRVEYLKRLVEDYIIWKERRKR